ncbi:MAG: CPBP family intramembrane metalloprotease [Akkermansia sp.]|nr:CPBP family intramembrane metalloprotease [Akkermansia sp.]
MIEKLSTLPLYQVINLGLLFGSMLLCLIVWLAGILNTQLLGRGLPRIPRYEGSIFPHPLEEGYTLLFIVGFTFLSLANITTDRVDESISPMQAWTAAFLTAAIYLPMALRYVALPIEQGIFRWRNLGTTAIALAIIYFVGIILQICGCMEWIQHVSGSPEQQQVTEDIAATEAPLTLAALLFSALVIAPVMEEFAFRGFIYNVLRQRAGIVAAAISSSLLFSAVHTSLVQAPVLFIFGCAQCYLYEKSRSIIYPMLLHAVFNSASTMLIFLASE